MYCIDTVQMASVICMYRTTSKHRSKSENHGMWVSIHGEMKGNRGEENVAD